MSSDYKLPHTRPAHSAAGRNSPAAVPLALSTAPHRTGNDPRSSDPYNTSGSFDRTKNWARVGKR